MRLLSNRPMTPFLRTKEKKSRRVSDEMMKRHSEDVGRAKRVGMDSAKEHEGMLSQSEREEGESGGKAVLPNMHFFLTRRRQQVGTDHVLLW
ncbi:hypothetical protein IE53DRAFT_286518 [Violaceomyces palustris]|uniref:Uncharacterized protein n=1 Tax=Violaceomyces palustris TaxID=1673888 RepID=A0ACD0NM70_9BASI|nr:hypothetical protein IE53DRAFT_286518 [Violaceomyces palustris]